MKTIRTISFVGAGALASGLARLLRAKGFRISEIVGRNEARSRRRAAALARAVGAVAVTLEEAELACDVLWLAVPDAAIAKVAGELAKALAEAGGAAGPRVVLHASGALSHCVLKPLAAHGVETGSAHPMMTFVAGEPPSLEGAWFALEGTVEAVRAARTIAAKLGARSFEIAPGSKELYHAFGAMLSPMLATELEAAERVGLQAGIDAGLVRQIMEPIVLRTVKNVLRAGAGKSFSGPLARGDVETVRGHLESLEGRPEGEVYRALMEYAAEVLPVKRGAEMKALLGRKNKNNDSHSARAKEA